jgi:hypothetical protein
MGDAESDPVRLSFNSQLRVEFRGATVSSDAGLLRGDRMYAFITTRNPYDGRKVGLASSC